MQNSCFYLILGVSMKLALYIYRMFFPLFLASLATFAFILEMVDLMMNIWRYIYNSVPVNVVGTIMLNFLPRTFTWALPLAFLFASCFMLSTLASNNELTALFASGVSLIEFTAPLLVVSAIFSVALFFFQDRVVVKASLKYEQVKSVALNQEKDLDNDNIVIISDGGKMIYKADHFDNYLQRLRNLCVVVRSEDKELRSIIFADYAAWNGEHWRTQNGQEYRYENGVMKIFPLGREIEKTLTELPETFRNNTVSVESATIEESRVYIRHLQKTGLPFSEALSQYYNKFSFPFVVFIVAFLSVGISGNCRRNVFVISLTLSLAAAVLFYVTQMITMLMAKFGMLPPIFGAWFPVALFVFLSFVLLKYSHT